MPHNKRKSTQHNTRLSFATASLASHFPFTHNYFCAAVVPPLHTVRCYLRRTVGLCFFFFFFSLFFFFFSSFARFVYYMCCALYVFAFVYSFLHSVVVLLFCFHSSVFKAWSRAPVRSFALLSLSSSQIYFDKCMKPVCICICAFFTRLFFLW